MVNQPILIKQAHLISAVGTSLVYQSAKYSDFDFGIGLYTSNAFFNNSSDPIEQIKAGKILLVDMIT